MSTDPDWFRDEDRLLRELRRGDLASSVGAETETVTKRRGDAGDLHLELAPQRIPERIGPFHIKRVIASGGMGTVYEAMQEHPRRSVAVKVMMHGVASRSAMRRFEYESQILARLRHPGIAQVFEAGTHNDGSGPVPFFAMEYIPNAKPITRYADDLKLSTRQRLGLFAHVCDAVHHGHQRGVIHRDLKPSNILVDSDGQSKIIDFGVARGTDSDMAITTLQTGVGHLIGTLQYMSPEQCEADPNDIDTRSDVYSLGVVLYELLCGRVPYDVMGKPVYECTRVIREQAPTRLSSVSGALKGDVETVVLKALDKDRTRRYQSAVELAQDIRRFLADEAITARPPSIVYQVRVFARRNKRLCGAVAALILVLAGGVVVSSWQAVRATRAERLAEGRLAEAQRQGRIAQAVNVFLNDDLLAAVDPRRTPNRDISMREVLDAASERIEGKFADEPLVEASVRSTIAQTYESLGLHEPAERHLRRVEAIHRRELGDESVETLETRTRMADLLRQRGWFVQAETAARAALEDQRRILGDSHTITARTLNVLGLTLYRQGKYPEAAETLSEALEIREHLLGEEHPDTLASMSSLAEALPHVRRSAEAADLHRRALATRRRLLGVEHPDTLGSMVGLALTSTPEEAEGALREALAIQRRVLGEDHPDTLESTYNLGGVLWNLGRLDECEALFKETLEARRRVLGVAHLSVLSTTDFLLRVLRSRGKIEQARPYVERAMAEADEARYVDVHTNPYELSAFAYARLTYEPVEFRDPAEALPMAEKAVEITGGTPPNLRTLAIAYEANGRLDDAIRTQERALSILPPAELYYRSVFETRQIHVLRKKGDTDPANAVSDRAVAQARELGGGNHAELVREMIELAVLLLEKDRFLQHEWFCHDLAQVRNGDIPARGLGIAGRVVVYASAILEQGRCAEAEPFLRHCLAIRRMALPEGEWHTAIVESALGAALAGQGKYEEAERMLLSAHEQLAVNSETPRVNIRVTAQRLVHLYDASGRPEEAGRWRTELEPVED